MLPIKASIAASIAAPVKVTLSATDSNKSSNCSNNINIGGSNPITVIAAAAVLTAEKLPRA